MQAEPMPSLFEKELKNEPYTQKESNTIYTHLKGKKKFRNCIPTDISLFAEGGNSAFLKAGLAMASISIAGIKKSAPNSRMICSRVSLGNFAKAEKRIHTQNKILLIHLVDFKKQITRFIITPL